MMNRKKIVKETFETKGIQDAMDLIIGWYSSYEIDRNERHSLEIYLIGLNR